LKILHIMWETTNIFGSQLYLDKGRSYECYNHNAANDIVQWHTLPLI